MRRAAALVLGLSLSAALVVGCGGGGSSSDTSGSSGGGSLIVLGASSLTEVLGTADAERFRAEFDVEPAAGSTGAAGDAAELRCSACGRSADPAAFARLWTRRLEGASDPADMLHVSGLRCPNCSSLGVLISPYGASADRAHVEVLRRLPSPPR